MKQFIKQIIKNTPLCHLFIRRPVVDDREDGVIISEWESRGRPVPPPHAVKRRAIRELAQKYHAKILVETGTYYGDMVYAMKGLFDQVYSIELSKELHRLANRRFKSDRNVEIIQGDSGVKLKELMGRIDKPTLFWLDGHYSAGVTARGSKDTPVIEELNQILSSPDLGHVIVIDDARCFGSEPNYPSIQDLKDFVRSKRPLTEITIADDGVRISPNTY